MSHKTFLAVFLVVLLGASLYMYAKKRDPLFTYFTPVLIDLIDPPPASYHTGTLSLGDYNNDGYDDIFVSNIPRGYLYKNTGETFTRVPDSETGVRFENAHMGLWSDFDNDGCQDLFVTKHSSAAFTFYEGDCTGAFTQQDGIFKQTVSTSGYGAASFDINNDRLLDVFAVSYDRAHHRNYRDRTPADVSDSPRNNGQIFDPVVFQKDNMFFIQKNGVFATQTDAQTQILNGDLFGSESCRAHAGIDGIEGKTLGRKFGFKQAYQPVWFDANNDGITDVFVTYDWGFSALYMQDADGNFRDATFESGLCKLGNAMGVAVGDVNNDGAYDLYITNTGSNYLFINDGSGIFTENSAERNVADFEGNAWGTSFADFNNDTLLDLALTNGQVRGGQWEFDERDRVYIQNQDGTFKKIDIDFRTLFTPDIKDNAALDSYTPTATGDLNRDGVPDAAFFQSHTGSLYVLYGKPNNNDWITFSLRGTESNRDAVGARVNLTTNGATQTRTVTAGSSYLSQNSRRLHFGLGENKEAYVDSVTILWPSGRTQTLTELEINTQHNITEPTD